MQSLPLISIIIPVYQAEKYIENTITNLEQQSYPNIEIVCIDDHSSDKSYDLCKMLADKYSNIRLFRNKTRQGVEYTRNYGICESSGEYLTFVDADDTVDSDMIETLLFSASLYNSDVVISGYKAVFNTTVVNHLASIEEGKFPASSFVEFMYDRCPLDVFCCIGGKLYRRDLLRNDCIEFDMQFKYNEDLAFITCVMKKAKTVSYVNKCFYNYLIRTAGSTMSSKRDNMFESMMRVQLLLKSLLIQYSVFEEKKSFYFNAVFILFLSSMMNEVQYGTFESFKSLLFSIRESTDYNETFQYVKQNKNSVLKHRLLNACINSKVDLLTFCIFKIKKPGGRY